MHVQERVRSPRAVSRHCSRQLSHTLSLVPSCTHIYAHRHTCLAQLWNGKQQAVAGHWDKRKEKRGGERYQQGLKASLKLCIEASAALAQTYVQWFAQRHKTICAIFRSIPYVKSRQLVYTATTSSWGNGRRWSGTPVTASSCASLETVSMVTAFSSH